MQTLYTTEVTSSGDGRNGKVRSSDGLLDTALALPKEAGGSGTATNPEQLFGAGYSACFHSALRLVARERKIKLSGDTILARVSLAQDEAGFLLDVELTASLPGLSQADAESLARDAHGRCPYSRAIRGNIDVMLRVAV
ncbi:MULTISPECIES: organic hydroperoxide resistance protein [unclassified Amycolatopsis]|uniref:organic hydroperoxide resistance protein n=1 Tax=unclassified Amycolatopsis TaxID=2618356 RepID=UPI002E109A17|nr:MULTISPECIES: organic hydroperoxide resistance protein [unclassified Amycolatopsis]